MPRLNGLFTIQENSVTLARQLARDNESVYDINYCPQNTLICKAATLKVANGPRIN
jgi:hypothetical protein